MLYTGKSFIFLPIAFISTNAVAQSTDAAVEPSFVSDQPGRGTVGLILSSVLTLVLCLWTAIHINVLEKPTTGKFLRRKIQWLLIGLSAPEAVLWCSYGQWREACGILRAVNEARVREAGRGETAASLSSNIHQRFAAWWNSPPSDVFDMESAFFVLMGGFTIGPRSFPHRELTVTPKGLISLLEHRIILPQTLDQCKRDIVDKAKAEVLSKLLVCAQGSWLIVQCIARHVQELPVTLLEIHIMVHVICTVFMYGFWWHKPFDAGRPMSLEIDDQLSAPLCVNSDIRNTGVLHVSRNVPGELWPGLPQSTRGDNPKMAALPGFVRYGAYPPWEWINRTSGLNKSGNGVLAFANQILVNREKGFYVGCTSAMAFVPDPVAEMEFYAFLADVLRSWPEHRNLCGGTIMRVDSADYPLVLSSSSPVDLCTEAVDFYSFRGATSVSTVILYDLVMAQLLALLYGGAHASAWNSHFPTDRERLLWRCSAIAIMLPLPIVLFGLTSLYIVLNPPSARFTRDLGPGGEDEFRLRPRTNFFRLPAICGILSSVLLCCGKGFSRG